MAGTGAQEDKSKKIISKVLNTTYQKSAGSRNSDGVDTDTCFGIPGSGLPRRHCNVDINISVAVTSELGVYLSINNGRMYQNVFGRKYKCKMYACPYTFEIYIPRGAKGWEDAKLLDSSGKDCSKDARLITDGYVEKTYDKSVPFEWKFGPPISLSEKQTIYEDQIMQKKILKVNQNGGYSEADSRYSYMGLLTDHGWKQEQGDGANGKIWLAGGILYPNATITSDIHAPGIMVEIPGLNLANFYYPGVIRQGDDELSLNRKEGYFRICSPSYSAEWLDSEGVWRDVKNTENDRAVEAGTFDNTGFRLEGKKWVRLILTGKFGKAEETEEGGIGSDSPGGSGNSSGCCCGRYTPA